MSQTRVPLRPVLAALSEGRGFKPLERSQETAKCLEETPRSHGRGLGELPPLFFTLKPHPNHSGSALFAIGDTRVSAAVSGPHPRVLQAHGKSQSAGRAQPRDAVSVTAASRLDATIELSLQLAPFAAGDGGVAGQRGTSDVAVFLSECLEAQAPEPETLAETQALRALAEAVMETLRSSVRTHNYPNSRIEISVLILSYDRSLLFPAIVNAVSLALMDAKLAVSDVLAACVSYVVKLPTASPYCCLALDDDELRRVKRAGGEVTRVSLAMLTSRGLIAYIDMEGVHLKPPYDQQSLALAESACLAIAREMGNCIRLDH
eukprot:Gregarina_sp_Pseudo_9__4037@NODE_417_length_2880_cov_26_442802_g394_i0_p1_GENE_NODE_417_length_2880_cov_26_442802_g394_i0NODE_417_length_2880_cov_26_442802_g394_i0_p1_ORF_typecomplete_len319_score147_38RNase_PH/PF01138_21/1_1e19_NODE_417_length_2880_cov_26_442802_g394_i010041960